MKKFLWGVLVCTLVPGGLFAFEDDFIRVEDSTVQTFVAGDERVYVFTNAAAGSLTVTAKKALMLKRFLAVGGGGAGGWTLGGGGGGGGVLDGHPEEVLATDGTITLSVGAGGDPFYESSTSWLRGGPGGNSTLAFSTSSFTAYGGGGGCAWSATGPLLGPYGSGGGCAANNRNNKPSGLVCQGYVLDPVSGQSYANGYPGGQSIKEGSGQFDYAGGGGGGAGGAGGNSGAASAGKGGLGITNDITGVAVEYAAGGGGGAGNGVKGQGLAGGVSAANDGLASGAGGPTPGFAAPDGFGGGGGGGGYSAAQPGGRGGAGTVILRLTDKIGTYFPLQVSVSGSGGVTLDGQAVTGSESFLGGSTVEVVAQPGSGYRFGYWSSDVTAITDGTRGSASVTVTVTKALSLKANFLPEGTTYVEETDGRLRLLVDVADETAFDAWCAAKTPVLADVSPFHDVVKRGVGTLLVTNRMFAGFLGDVYVEAGRVKTTLQDALGPATSGKVVVSSNATLHVRGTANASVPFGSKPVHFAGTGTDGKGALYDEQPDTGPGTGLPYVQYLTGDASIGSKWRENNHGAGSVHLEGHTITVDLRGDYGVWNPHVYDSTGNGHIIIAQTPLFSGTQNYRFGTPANTVTISKGCFFRTHNSTVSAPWTLVMAPGSWFQPTDPSTWTGPVTLSEHHRVTRQNGYNWCRQTFLGPISGPGGIGTSGNATETEIVLSNTTNTFLGGVYLKGNILTLGGNGSLPPNGQALTNFNGSVNFKASQPVHDLPEAYFSGTGMVRCTASGGVRTVGAWRNRMVKDGAGELTYDVLVGSPKLEVRGGSLYLPFGTEATDLPVFTNVQVRTGASVRFDEGFAGNWTVPELVTGGGAISNTDVTVTKTLVVRDDLQTGETLAIGGSLTFAADAVLSVPETLSHQPHRTYVLATAREIVDAPARTGSKHWFARKVENANGTESLCIDYAVGALLIFR